MAMVGRIVEKPTSVTTDDGETFRSCRVLLPSGHKATVYIHDSPGDWLRYNEGDRVRLSMNVAGDGDAGDDSAAGMSVIGKFGDDFEPEGEDNREIHGPKDANLVIKSRQDLVARADGTVRLGNGAGGDQDPIAINNETLGDAEALYELLNIADPTTPLGAIFAAINTGLSGALTPLLTTYAAAYELAKPTAKGAENVTAKAATT